MGKNSISASQGSFLVGVDTEAKNTFDIIDLIRAKKEAAGIYGTAEYDLNGNGVTDEEDIALIKKKLLGVK